MQLRTDEQICKLDIVPEVFPNFFLGRARDVDKITADFDVGAVYNRKFGANFLDQGNKSGHLWVILKSQNQQEGQGSRHDRVYL